MCMCVRGYVHGDQEWEGRLEFHLRVKQVFLKIICIRWKYLQPYNCIQIIYLFIYFYLSFNASFSYKL